MLPGDRPLTKEERIAGLRYHATWATLAALRPKPGDIATPADLRASAAWCRAEIAKLESSA